MLSREGGGHGAEETGGESPDVYRGSGYRRWGRSGFSSVTGPLRRQHWRRGWSGEARAQEAGFDVGHVQTSSRMCPV